MRRGGEYLMVVVEGDNVEALGALRPLSALTLIRGLARSTEMPAELLISIAFEYALERGGCLLSS